MLNFKGNSVAEIMAAFDAEERAREAHEQSVKVMRENLNRASDKTLALFLDEIRNEQARRVEARIEAGEFPSLNEDETLMLVQTKSPVKVGAIYARRAGTELYVGVQIAKRAMTTTIR